jgi:hypothetical protein
MSFGITEDLVELWNDGRIIRGLILERIKWTSISIESIDHGLISILDFPPLLNKPSQIYSAQSATAYRLNTLQTG